MIEPTRFGFNEEAFVTNKFQNRPEDGNMEVIQAQALDEFKRFVQQLESLDVDVTVFRDLENSTTPDSIFPNNWISTHRSGELVLYPMAVSNRRKERRPEIVHFLTEKYGFEIFDFSSYETTNPEQFLEGTGSLIFDHNAKKVYAALSPRTDEALVVKVGKQLGYKPVTFKSYGKEGELIYHTNVMMCIGNDYVILGEETIDAVDRNRVVKELLENGKEIIRLTNEQVYDHFAGNMLQIKNKRNETVLVMSDTAFASLTNEQQQRLHELNDHIVAASIPTIEHIGGGSARCMIAELFFEGS